MAKAPRPNHVKTRLVPPLTPHEAARSPRASCATSPRISAKRAGRRSIPGFVAYAPAGCEALFDGMLAPGTQLGAGRRHDPTCRPGVNGFGRVAAPCGDVAAGAGLWRGLPGEFRQSHPADGIFASMQPRRWHGRATAWCWVCADDGGYYLIGLKAPHAASVPGHRLEHRPGRAQTLARAATAWVWTWSRCRPGSMSMTRPRCAGWSRIWTTGADRRAIPYAAPATRAWIEQVGAWGTLSDRRGEAGRDAKNPRPLVGLGREAHQVRGRGMRAVHAPSPSAYRWCASRPKPTRGGGVVLNPLALPMPPTAQRCSPPSARPWSSLVALGLFILSWRELAARPRSRVRSFSPPPQCLAGLLWLGAIALVRSAIVPAAHSVVRAGCRRRDARDDLRRPAAAVQRHLPLCLGRPRAARRHQSVSLPAGCAATRVPARPGSVSRTSTAPTTRRPSIPPPPRRCSRWRPRSPPASTA